MYKTILVPLDGSHRAEKILPQIEMLAQCMKAKIILLRVYQIDYGRADMIVYNPSLFETLAKNCKDAVLDYLTEIYQRLHAKGVQVQIMAEEGDVVNTILSVANREDADLIAMSSHGRTGLARVFYGSIAAGVLHKIDRPLLLVRAEDPLP
jgi:nucleotide-binding universal stress UspA family protein